MKSITRRGVMASAGVLAAGLGARPSKAAAKFRWHFGSSIASSHPNNVRMREVAARVLKATDGQFEIMCFADGALGGDTQMLSQVRSGAIQAMDISPLILSTVVPVAAISDVGFAFASYKDVWPAMDGALGDVVREQIATKGLHPFHRIFDNGFRQVTANPRPIHGPEDFHGLKLRVPVSPILVSMFKALGAAPTALNFNEVYTSLQTGVVDGQENPLPIIETSKLFQVQKYCSLTNHVWDGHWIVANPAAYAALPADMRKVLDDEMSRAALLERADIEKMNHELQAQLSGQGLKFNTPDHAAIQAALVKSGFYADWKAQFGPKAWGALETAVGKLS